MKEYLDPICSLKRTTPECDFALPRALLWAKIEGDLRSAKLNPVANAAIIRDLTNHRRRFKDTDGTWLREAKDLVVRAKLDPFGHKSSLKDLDAFAKVLPDYNIQVFQRVDPMKKYELKWVSDFDSDKKIISIVLFNDSIDSFLPCRRTIGHTICNFCHRSYSRSCSHRCDHQCNLCCRFNCNGKPLTDPITCTDCNTQFTREDCFTAHKKQRGTYRTMCRHLQKKK